MPFNVPTRPPSLKQICRQHEKPLVLQLCRLVLGFTHPASYFAGDGNPSSSKNRRNSRGTDGGNREDLALFSVDEFSAEMVRDPCPEMPECHEQHELEATTKVVDILVVMCDWAGGRSLHQRQILRSRTNRGIVEVVVV